MNRGEFLKGLVFGGGAVIATKSLPAVAADNPSAFPGRGQFERLTVSMVHVHAGATQPFSLLHVSDTHLADAYPHEPRERRDFAELRTRVFGGRQEEALRDTLEYARLHADYLVHTGDLIDFQSERNLDLVKMYFGGSPKTQVAMGNHEYSDGLGYHATPRTEAFKAGSREALSAAYPQPIDFAAQTVNGVNFITLDDVYGSVTAAQVEKFAAEVKKGLPIILCMHVPFHTETSWMLTKLYWTNGRTRYRGERPDVGAAGSDYHNQLHDPVTRDFIASLKREPLLKALLVGHEHFFLQEQFSPTAVQVFAAGNYLHAANLIAID